MKKKMLSVVIFGRTNVGKSTLFNKLSEASRALVSDIEGTTRDANLTTVEWQGFEFSLVDTGGIMDLAYLLDKKDEAEDIEARVQKQARDYIKKADLILFLVDTKAGILPQDREMASLLKKIIKNSKKIVLVANKADSPNIRKEASVFYKLSLGEPQIISASSGSGTGDLLDEVILRLKDKLKKNVEEEKEYDDKISICFIGKPNAGKSSLVNKLLGHERVIVSPTPHTTREPQDIYFEHNNKLLRMVDTAGLSRRGQKSLNKKKITGKITDERILEKLSIDKSFAMLNKSDIALLMVDINDDLTRLDSKIVEEIVNRKKSMIIVANKWDLVKDKDVKKYTEEIYSSFPFATWAPIIFLSAKTGAKVSKVLELIEKVYEERKTEITESQMQKFLSRMVKIHKPAKGKGTKHPHIFEITQKSANPPIFQIRIGSKDNIHFSYVRFLSNRLREKFGFLGTPISLKVIRNKKIHGQHESRLK